MYHKLTQQVYINACIRRHGVFVCITGYRRRQW